MTDSIGRAQRAAQSTRLLLDVGDIDGACNRAYYAMYEAARTALITTTSPVQPEVIRSHSGLISAFSLNLVKPGHIPVELGRTFNRVEELRLIADYRGDTVDVINATWAVEQAERFVEYIRNYLSEQPPTHRPGE